MTEDDAYKAKVRLDDISVLKADFRKYWVDTQGELASTWRPNFIRFLEICHADLEDPREHLRTFLDVDAFLEESSVVDKDEPESEESERNQDDSQDDSGDDSSGQEESDVEEED
jgi:hypothetical protein